MDAIVELGHQAAAMQKEAFIGKAIGGFVDKGLKHGITKAVAGGGRKLAPVRAAASGVGLAGAGLGAADAYQGLTGGWKGNQNLDWHRQRMQGSGSTGMQGMFNSAYSMATNPVQSFAAYYGGHGENGPKTLNGKLAPKYHQAQSNYNQANANIRRLSGGFNDEAGGIQDSINAIRTGGIHDGYASPELLERGQKLALEKARLQQQMQDGTYGQSWLSRNMFRMPFSEQGIGAHQDSLQRSRQLLEESVQPGAVRDEDAWQQYLEQGRRSPQRPNYGFTSDMQRYL